jgi:hypothetical protein
MKHQSPTIPAMPKGRRDRERIDPPAMPVISAHDRANDRVINDRNKEQLRLRPHFIGDRQSRISLRPRRVRILGEHIAPQSDHSLAIARIESANDHSESSTLRSIDSI